MFTPLQGIRILDLTRLLPGPYCSWVLGALGAEVLRVEDPRGGDYLRLAPPPLGRHGAPFVQLNRGKRSIVVDLRQEDGVAVLRRLAGVHDVLLEGNRPGTLDRLGVGPDTLRAEHPALIVCSLSGYGQTGPRASRAGHDLSYEALGGTLWLNREADGPPVLPPVPMADLGGALQGALGVFAALVPRSRTGEGCHVDVSLAEAAAAMTAPMVAIGGFADDGGRGRGVLDGGVACYGVYRTADGGYLAIAALEPKFWTRLCDALEHPEWAAVPPIPGPQQEEVRAGLTRVVATRTRDEWVRVLGDLDVCVEPVLSPAEVVEDEHLRTRGRVEGSGAARWCGPVLGRSPAGEAPDAGEHTDAVLRELGYSDAEVADLRRREVVG